MFNIILPFTPVFLNPGPSLFGPGIDQIIGVMVLLTLVLNISLFVRSVVFAIVERKPWMAIIGIIPVYNALVLERMGKLSSWMRCIYANTYGIILYIVFAFFCFATLSFLSYFRWEEIFSFSFLVYTFILGFFLMHFMIFVRYLLYDWKHDSGPVPFFGLIPVVNIFAEGSEDAVSDRLLGVVAATTGVVTTPLFVLSVAFFVEITLSEMLG